MPAVNLIRLKQFPIFRQLQLEEALLRADQRNWCILNEGSAAAIVLGISGKPELHLHQEKVLQSNIPVIRRFSGGGTVVVDLNTIFATMIFNADSSGISCCPRKIMGWSQEVYSKAFPGFHVRENDYVFGDKKFGGNAQYLSKNRWLHHTSLLWDYDPHLMEHLQMPWKQPAYRAQRSHLEFLCRLKDHIESYPKFIDALMSAWDQAFHLREWDVEDVQNILDLPHRKATCLLR